MKRRRCVNLSGSLVGGLVMAVVGCAAIWRWSGSGLWGDGAVRIGLLLAGLGILLALFGDWIDEE